MSASEARGGGAGAPVPARVSTGAPPPEPPAGAAVEAPPAGAGRPGPGARGTAERGGAAHDKERMANGHKGINGRIDSAGRLWRGRSGHLKMCVVAALFVFHSRSQNFGENGLFSPRAIERARARMTMPPCDWPLANFYSFILHFLEVQNGPNGDSARRTAAALQQDLGPISIDQSPETLHVSSRACACSRAYRYDYNSIFPTLGKSSSKDETIRLRSFLWMRRIAVSRRHASRGNAGQRTRPEVQP
jgi:hypothetical protein